MRVSLIFCCLIPIFSFAQRVEVTITYYDEDGYEIAEGEGSYYYEIDSTRGVVGRSDAFYTKSNVRRHIVQAGNVNEPRRFLVLYENGTVMLDGNIKRRRPVGLLRFNYPTGAQLAELDATDAGVRILRYWDIDGKKKVENGNGSGYFEFPYFVNLGGGEGKVVNGLKHGVWKNGDAEAISWREEYEAGKLIKGKTVTDSIVYEYANIEEGPEFEGGLEVFKQYLLKQMKSNCKISWGAAKFIIDTDGRVSNVKTLRGVSEKCEGPLQNAILSSPKWKPGKFRGIPVKRYFIFPFSLTYTDEQLHIIR